MEMRKEKGVIRRILRGKGEQGRGKNGRRKRMRGILRRKINSREMTDSFHLNTEAMGNTS